MNRELQINSIANQIVRCGKSNMKISEANKAQCLKEYKKEIDLAMELLPQIQITFLAVIAKALKSQHKEKVIQFCNDFKNKKFLGHNDPIFLLWRFLKTANRNPENLYAGVTYALDSYIKGSAISRIRNDRPKLFS